MIDVIDHDNFGYETQAGDAMRGAFDWEMYYKRIPIPTELQKDDPSEPFEWVQLFLTRLKNWRIVSWLSYCAMNACIRGTSGPGRFETFQLGHLALHFCE